MIFTIVFELWKEKAQPKCNPSGYYVKLHATLNTLVGHYVAALFPSRFTHLTSTSSNSSGGDGTGGGGMCLNGKKPQKEK